MEKGLFIFHAFYEGGELGVLGEWFTVGFTVHRGPRRFWARRARTSVDVLGLGVLVGRVAGFGVS
jgi:hypothetical protein